MTPERLREIRALLEAATPGVQSPVGPEWWQGDEAYEWWASLIIAGASYVVPDEMPPISVTVQSHPWPDPMIDAQVHGATLDDVTLMAQAKTIIAELLTEVERYREYEANAVWENDDP